MTNIKWPNVIAGGYALGVFVFAGFWLFTHHGIWHKPAPQPAVVSSHINETSQTKPVVVAPVRVTPARPVFHRVLPHGKLDGVMNCKRVEGFRQYPYSMVQQYANQYGIPPAVVEKYRVCFN
jgi:hypothetical protein